MSDSRELVWAKPHLKAIEARAERLKEVARFGPHADLLGALLVDVADLVAEVRERREEMCRDNHLGPYNEDATVPTAEDYAEHCRRVDALLWPYKPIQLDAGSPWPVGVSIRSVGERPQGDEVPSE